MSSFCQVVVVGNLCADVELRYLPNGAAVGNVNIAVNRRWKTESGEDRDEACFIPCTLWGKTGETVAQYARKGAQILFSGYLKTESWDDKATGQKRSKIVMVVSTFQFLGGKKDGTDTDTPSERRASRPPPGSAAARADTGAQEDAPLPGADDSDVPF